MAQTLNTKKNSRTSVRAPETGADSRITVHTEVLPPYNVQGHTHHEKKHKIKGWTSRDGSLLLDLEGQGPSSLSKSKSGHKHKVMSGMLDFITITLTSDGGATTFTMDLAVNYEEITDFKRRPKAPTS